MLDRVTLFTDTRGADMRLVNVESPLRGHVPRYTPWFARSFIERCNRLVNQIYACACVRDSLVRGEAPYASHVFFDRDGILDDAKPEERSLGMACGRAWARQASLHAFYLDRGWSRGMQEAHDLATRMGWEVELRYLSKRNRQGAAKDHEHKTKTA